MKHFTRIALAAAAALLVGCEAKIGNEAGAGDVSAEGKAEEGKVAIKAPGFDLSINIPKGLADRADHDGKLLYPGSAVTGVYVAGAGGDGKGEVELRFRTADAPGEVAAWYRDPARAADFEVRKAAREGAETVIEGEETRRDRQAFRLRLSPREGGGTDGRLVVRGS